MQAGVDGDLQLGADAVGGGDQQRVVIARGLEVEEGPEAAQPAFRARTAGGLGQRLDGFDEGVSGVDIDSGLRVGEAIGPVGHLSLGYFSWADMERAATLAPCRLARSRGYS
ncbi:hypothetical protein D3C83_68930 [compost metagenome]